LSQECVPGVEGRRGVHAHGCSADQQLNLRRGDCQSKQYQYGYFGQPEAHPASTEQVRQGEPGEPRRRSGRPDRRNANRNTEGYRPGNSGWSTLASAIPPRWEAGGGRHLALAGDDPRCAYQPLARCWCGALARHGGSTSVGCAWCAHAHTAPPSCR